MCIHSEYDQTLAVGRGMCPFCQDEKIASLRAALEPFTKLGGPNDGVMPAYHDLPDDVVVCSNSGECVTAGDVRAARNAFGILHAPWKIPSHDEQKLDGKND